MSDDECPDFDETLRRMLSTPRVPHAKPEPPDEEERTNDDEPGEDESC